MEVVLNFLYSIVSLFVVDMRNVGSWNVIENWKKNDSGYSFLAEVSVSELQCGDGKFLKLPQVVHGVHQVLLDNKLIVSSGDSTFQKGAPFYYSPSIDCKLLESGSKITWQVTTYSKFFARINQPPVVTESKGMSAFFDLQLNLMAFSTLVAISLFAIVTFMGKISKDKFISALGGGLLLAMYSVMTVNTYLPFNISMLAAHKIADISLSVGLLLYYYTYYKNGLLSGRLYTIIKLAALVGNSIILFGSTGDSVQIGTTFQMPFVFMGMVTIAFNLFQSMRFEAKISSAIEFASIQFFIFAGLNDLMQIFGIINSFMVLPLGATIGFFFYATAVNQDIEKTYSERNDLFKNLENKVKEQTDHLTLALNQVKKSQAELVQSARLASLGTLSAGIAHEINNSINYVSGAIIPLERRVTKFVPESEKEIVGKLFAAIKEGTNLTVEIVRSLRNFTGLNQSKVKDAFVKSMVDSVVTILRSRLSQAAVEVEVSIDPGLTLECHQVGINQVFMNLISNSIDAMKQSGGKILVAATSLSEELVRIEVSDNGSGIPNDVLERIFDPFFTTKEVGKGTGLGLHIVQKEIERHNGIISIKSEVNKGTKFTIDLPKHSTIQISSEAA